MERKIYGIFVAGGSGIRMGGNLPKQFLELDGIPVLQRTIERFVDACPGINVITVLPRTHFETWDRLCTLHNFNCRQILVEGGLTRFHSVRNALAKVPDGATVLIHDGVRPLVSTGLIRSMLERCTGSRGLIPVLPCFDTLKTLEKGPDGELCTSEAENPDRNRIFCAQTPQIFRSEDIKAAYRQAYDIRFTDDASVAQSKKIPLSYVEGERWNIKITTPDDLEIARVFLTCLS